MYLFLWLFGRSILPQELPLEEQPRGGQAGAAVRLIPGGRGGAQAVLHGISATVVTLKNGVTVRASIKTLGMGERGGIWSVALCVYCVFERIARLALTFLVPESKPLMVQMRLLENKGFQGAPLRKFNKSSN